MSVSDEATLTKNFVEVNPPQSRPWKQNGITVEAAVMILEVVNYWRSVLQINILKKKLGFEPKSTFVTGNVTNMLWLVPTWRICQTEILEEKHFKLSDYFNQI